MFGIDDFIEAAFVVSALTTVSSTVMQAQAAEAAATLANKQVKTQELTTQAKIAKSNINEAATAVQYLQRNRLVAQSRGEALNSPGFNAIQLATLKHAGQALQSNATYSEVNELTSDQRRHTIATNEQYKIAGSVIGGISQVALSAEQGYLFNNVRPLRSTNYNPFGSNSFGSNPSGSSLGEI